MPYSKNHNTVRINPNLSPDEERNMLDQMFKRVFTPPPPTKEELEKQFQQRWGETKATIVVNWKRGGWSRYYVIVLIWKSISFSKKRFVEKFWKAFEELHSANQPR